MAAALPVSAFSQGLATTKQAIDALNLDLVERKQLGGDTKRWFEGVIGKSPVLFFTSNGEMESTNALSHVVIFAAGDGAGEVENLRQCRNFKDSFNKADMPGVLIACVHRIYHDDQDVRRSQTELSEFLNIVGSLKQLYSMLPLSCAGKSGGANMCALAAQARGKKFACLALASGSLSLSAHHESRGGSVLPSQLDSLNNVGDTSAELVYVLGDNTGADQVVTQAAWEEYVDALRAIDHHVSYIPTPGAGHNTYEALMAETPNCLRAYDEIAASLNS